MSPSIGHIIHVCIGTEHGEPVLRPATVVRVWSDDCVNALLSLDGLNDDRHSIHYAPSVVGEGTKSCSLFAPREPGACKEGVTPRTSDVVWVTSTIAGGGVGQWRWPARA